MSLADWIRLMMAAARFPARRLPAPTYWRSCTSGVPVMVWRVATLATSAPLRFGPPLRRFLLAALVLGMLVVIHEGWPRWSLKEWLTLGALGASGIFLYNLCFLYGLRVIEAGRGALVVALTPAVVAVGDWLLFRAPMSPMKAAGIALAMAMLPEEFPMALAIFPGTKAES